MTLWGFSISSSNLRKYEIYEVLMRVGIVSAFGKETKPLRSKMREIDREPVGDLILFLMRHRGKEIMVVKTGSGKARGARGTQLLIRRYHPEIVINCGVAGAISPERKIGHVVISERVIEYDAAAEGRMKNAVYHADEKLITCALHISQQFSPEVHVVIGEENKEPAIKNCSVVISQYGLPDEATGAIGVVGPTRMAYSHAIPTVHYLSSVLSELVAGLYGKEIHSE